MASGLSKEEREKFKALLAAAEPYPDDGYIYLERPVDFARERATIAKEILDENPEEEDE